jgi:hypothetical protein
MTLWSIARSPLIMGGDLRHLDQATLDLLTNPEVIAVNQHSSDNRPHFLADDTRIWSARHPDGDTYLALFNTAGKPRELSVPLSQLDLRGTVHVRDCWARTDAGTAAGRIARTVPSHGAVLLRLSG